MYGTFTTQLNEHKSNKLFNRQIEMLQTCRKTVVKYSQLS